MDNCQLLRPEWLWLALPLALLVFLLSQCRARTGHWHSVCDSKLLPFILQSQTLKTSHWPLLITALAGLLAIIALSGPVCEQREQPVFRDQSALVIALDLSRSMDATDIKPSRLVRARLKLIDILKQRQEGQTALVVYAAQAFTVSPLTDDTDTIISLVNSLDSNMMPQQGSDSTIAIAQSAQLLQQASIPKGDILLITDGISNEYLQATLNEIKTYQHRVSVLSVGTTDGAPIAMRDGGFLKDKNAAIVIPKLKEAALQQLAQQGNGRYHNISNDDSDLNYLLDIITAEDDSKEAVSGLNTDQWREEGPWLLLLLLPLAALAFRRGYLVVIALLIIPLPNDVYAAELWLNQNQLAHKQLLQGNAEHAAELFNNPEWKAAAFYRAGQYQQSIDALQDINNTEALYNKANALAKMGRIQAAIESYEKVLKQQPNHEDAEYNLNLLKQKPAEQGQEKNNESEQESEGDNPQQQGEEQQSDQAESQQQTQQGSQQQQKQTGDEQQQMSQQAEQQSEQERAEQMQQSQQKNNENSDAEEEQQAQPDQEFSEVSESDIATEQWLRRIPDDPGGLMRRKFQYQYQQQSQQRHREIEPW